MITVKTLDFEIEEEQRRQKQQEQQPQTQSQEAQSSQSQQSSESSKEQQSAQQAQENFQDVQQSTQRQQNAQAQESQVQNSQQTQSEQSMQNSKTEGGQAQSSQDFRSSEEEQNAQQSQQSSESQEQVEVKQEQSLQNTQSLHRTQERAQSEQQSSEGLDLQESSDSEVSEESKDEDLSESEDAEEGADDDESYERSYESDEGQANSYTYNTQEVVEIRERKELLNATKFWRIVENLLEEDTKDEAENERGLYFFDVKKAIKRTILRKALSYAYSIKEKESVVLILDDSGSMAWWTEELNVLANLAFQRNDIEVYLAPNGEIVSKRAKRAWIEVRKPKFENRTIIYVGDYDGTVLPVTLSRNNKVIWICPESRYLEPEEHDWARPHLRKRNEFKGIFIRAYTLEEMLHYLAKVHPYTVKAVYDPHEHEFYQGD